MLLKKNPNPSPFFFHKTIGSNNPFTQIENNFRFLRWRSLNSRWQYSMAYGQNAPSCDPLTFKDPWKDPCKACVDTSVLNFQWLSICPGQPKHAPDNFKVMPKFSGDNNNNNNKIYDKGHFLVYISSNLTQPTNC